MNEGRWPHISSLSEGVFDASESEGGAVWGTDRGDTSWASVSRPQSRIKGASGLPVTSFSLSSGSECKQRSERFQSLQGE